MRDFLMHLPLFLVFLGAAALLVVGCIEFGAWSVLRRRRLQEKVKLGTFRGRGVDVVIADVRSRQPVHMYRPRRPAVYCERSL